jgi:hypothetical protein
VSHRRSVDNCTDIKTEDSTRPRDLSNGSLNVGLTESSTEVRDLSAGIGMELGVRFNL